MAYFFVPSGYSQVLTPLFCLSFVYIIKILVQSQFGTQLQLPFPFLNDMPGYLELFSSIEYDCYEWYLYDFDQNATLETRRYVGANNGKPGEEKSGLLGRFNPTY